MKKKYQNPIAIVTVSIAFLLSLTYCSKTTNNWSQFRGPGVSMVVNSDNLPTAWGDSLNIRWEQPMEGESWSSPIIYGDKVFYSSALLVKKATPESDSATTNMAGTAPQQQQDNQLKNEYQLLLTCLDLKTGKELWKEVSYEGTPKIKKHDASTYACETPVTDGKRICAYFGMHGIYCYDMNGNLTWKNDLGVYNTLMDWGTGSSPVLYNDIVYVQVDNEENSFIVALDATTGDEIWKKQRNEKTTYSTPVIWKNDIRTELVTLGSIARSYDPATGDLLWEMKIERGTSIPSPVFDGQHIYLGNAGGPGKPGNLFAVKAGAEGDITTSEAVIWSDTIAGTGNPSPLLYNGLIYLLASRGGEVTCLDAATGELVYREKAEKVGACWSTPWVYNDLLYFYDERGNTTVIKTGRDFEVVGSYSIKDKFWASIAAANDAYIFKGVENIYCVGI